MRSMPQLEADFKMAWECLKEYESAALDIQSAGISINDYDELSMALYKRLRLLLALIDSRLTTASMAAHHSGLNYNDGRESRQSNELFINSQFANH
jgi:hypothetical protein